MFARLASRPTEVEIEIPVTIDAGHRVWLTAQWFNARAQTGPSSNPHSAIVGEGLVRLAA